MALFGTSGQFGGGFGNPNFGGTQPGANANMFGGLPNASFGGMRPASGVTGGADTWQDQLNKMNLQNSQNQQAYQNNFMNMFKSLTGTDNRSTNNGLNGGMVNPTAAINAAQPGITRTMTGNMNEAASRMGDLGMMGLSNGKMAAGTPYADMLGQAAQEATDSTAEITNKYLYDAAKTNQSHQMDLMNMMGDWAKSGLFGSMGGGSSAGGGGSYGGSGGGRGGSGGGYSGGSSASAQPAPDPLRNADWSKGLTYEQTQAAVAKYGPQGMDPRNIPGFRNLSVGDQLAAMNQWNKFHGTLVGDTNPKYMTQLALAQAPPSTMIGTHSGR